MSTRRRFLGCSALALGGAALGAASESTPSAGGHGTADAASDLPPAVAALGPLKSKPEPISSDERRSRLARAGRLTKEHGLDALLLTGGTSLTYFTGMKWGLSERLLAVVLPVRGKPFVVTPAFEEERAREQMAHGPLGPDAEVLAWHEHESPYRLVADGLRSRGLATGTLGVEETVRFVFSDSIAAAAPGLRLASGTAVTGGCRTIKDAHEIELMRTACAVTLRAFEATYRSLAEGMTREDVHHLIAAAHQQQGYSGGALVLVGADTALPHGSERPQVVREGTIILIDGGCGVEGYRSDISRTFVLGKPTDRMKKIFDIELRAQTAALAASRPGVECQAVDAAARKVIHDSGFGPGYRYFTHRVGHGIGMDGHEWPYLVQGNNLALAPGMTFSDEPGIYLPGEFGVRLEDDMVITAGGAELLTPQSPSLEDPFGPAKEAS
jgi:Xaa-Pro dipeptidase